MEVFNINTDTQIICVTAESFPDGIMAAYEKLESLIPDGDKRTFYGISYGTDGGKVIYKAAVEESHPGEAEKLGAESFVIKSGKYLGKKLFDWKKDVSVFGRTFQELLKDPRIDKNGYCLEKYLDDKEVICMVPLDPSKN